jgi:hypothetical protein
MRRLRVASSGLKPGCWPDARPLKLGSAPDPPPSGTCEAEGPRAPRPVQHPAPRRRGLGGGFCGGGGVLVPEAELEGRELSPRSRGA